MEILDSIWDADDNYTKADSIRQCWKKSGALSPTAKADMNNEIGSFSMSEKKKIISNEESMELCALLSASTTKYQQLREFPLLKECLAEEEMLTMTELPKNINYQVVTEDDPAVIEAEIGKVINEMEIEIDPAEATEEIDKDSYAVTCMVRVVHEVF